MVYVRYTQEVQCTVVIIFSKRIIPLGHNTSYCVSAKGLTFNNNVLLLLFLREVIQRLRRSNMRLIFTMLDRRPTVI